jgi:hypothetical protein
MYVRQSTILLLIFIGPFQLVYPVSAHEAVWDTTAAWRETAGPDGSLFLFMAAKPPSFEPVIVAASFFNGPAKAAKEKFALFYTLDPIQDFTKEVPYKELNGLFESFTSIQYGGRKVVRACLFSSIGQATFRPVFDEYIEFVKKYPDAAPSVVAIEFYGFDKVMEVPVADTAFGHRGKWYQANAICHWSDPGLEGATRNFPFLHLIGLVFAESVGSGA